MGVRLVHDKNRLAAAALACFCWQPRDGRRRLLTAGVEFTQDDLDDLISALNQKRERMRQHAKMLRKNAKHDAVSAQELKISETEHFRLRSLEYRLTTVRDELKREQAWRNYEGKHPKPRSSKQTVSS